MPRGVYERKKKSDPSGSNISPGTSPKGEKPVEVPVKVSVSSDPLNLQVTIDPISLDEACKTIEKRCNELASYFQVAKEEVNPFEALWLIADLNREILDELKKIREVLQS